jgi:hypothetical protein
MGDKDQETGMKAQISKGLVGPGKALAFVLDEVGGFLFKEGTDLIQVLIGALWPLWRPSWESRRWGEA